MTYRIGTVVTGAITNSRRFKHSKQGRRHVVVGRKGDKLICITFTSGQCQFGDVQPTRTNGFSKMVDVVTDIKVIADSAALKKVGVLDQDTLTKCVQAWKQDKRSTEVTVN